jgi:hypothetical protein
MLFSHYTVCSFHDSPSFCLAPPDAIMAKLPLVIDTPVPSRPGGCSFLGRPPI